MNKILTIIDKFENTALYRMDSVTNGLRKKRAKINTKCTNEQIKEVKLFWKGLKINEYWWAFYNKIFNENKVFDVRFLPDDIYFCFIDPYFNSREASKYLDDKNLYDLLYPDIKRPNTLIRKINGCYLDKFYCPINVDDVMFNPEGVLISKIPYGPGGGKGIRIWHLQDEMDVFIKYISEHPNIIVQDFIEQHPLISALHKDSVNTIRLITFYHNNDVDVLSKIIRMGTGGNHVDNAHSGGIFCGIDDEGKLKKYAYNTIGDKFENHPTSNIKFDGYVIPNINDCLIAVKKLALRLSKTNKLLNWDLAIDKDGNPVFIEVNMAKGELDFHQMTNGPLFGDTTNKVIEEVFSKKSKRIIQRIFG